MQFSEWEHTYTEILADMGYRREDDEMAVRILKMVTVNSDLMDPDDLSTIIGREARMMAANANPYSVLRAPKNIFTPTINVGILAAFRRELLTS